MKRSIKNYSKKLYLLVFVTLCGNVYSQSYMPIPSTNATWMQATQQFQGSGDITTTTESLYFGNDSIISGVTYHTLRGEKIVDWVIGWGNQQLYQSGSNYYTDQLKVIFRQDIPNKKVYQWDNNTNQEQLLYDFGNLTVGQPYPQTLNNIFYPQLLVMAYDSVMLNDGLYHERWVLGSNSNDSGFVSIIEGMGSTAGFNLPIYIPFEISSQTLCFKIGNNSVYDGWGNYTSFTTPRYTANCDFSEFLTSSISELTGNQSDVSVWPIPVISVLSIKSEEKIERIVLYDLLGNKIIDRVVNNVNSTELSLSHLASGAYILKVYNDDNKFVSKRVVR